MNRKEKKQAKLAKKARENETVSRVDYITAWSNNDPEGFYRYFDKGEK